MASLAQINIGFKADMAEFSKQMQTVNRKLKKTGEQMKSVGRDLSVSLSLPLAAAGAFAFKMAADFEDALGATDQIFKNASESTKQWADSLPSYFGIAKQEALEYSNLMGSMLQNIGKLTDKEASEQSAKLIELAGDLTAMYGGQTQDAVRALTGALKGNNSMLDNYGIAVNEATVKQRAYEMGLVSQGETMSLAAKQAATLSLIYEQTGAAQGQAAREADGASGSWRALKVELQNLATQFGQELLPMITPVIQKVKDLISQFGELSPETKKIIVVIGAAVAAIGPLLGVIGSILVAAPGLIKSFQMIKLAVIDMNKAFLANPITAAIAAITALAGAYLLANSRLTPLVDAQKEYNDVIKKATKSVTKEVAETRSLIKVAQDKTVADDQRKKALEKLISKSEEHFGSLTLETINTDNARKATENYTKALLQNARVKAAEEKLVEIQKRRIDLEFGVSDEVDPSVIQKAWNQVKGALTPMPTASLFDAESVRKNTKKVEQELASLENQLQSIINAEGDYSKVLDDNNDVVTDNTTYTNNNTNALKKQEEAIASLKVGTVAYYDEIIKKLREAQSSQSTDPDTFQSFEEQIAGYEKLKQAITDKQLVENSPQWFRERIDQMEKDLEYLKYGSDAYDNLIRKITDLKDIQKSFEMKYEEPEVGSIEWYDFHIDGLKRQMEGVKSLSEEYEYLQDQLEILENSKQIELELNTDETREQIEATKLMFEALSGGINDVFNNITNSMIAGMGEAENGFERFTQSLLSNILKVISGALSGALANAILSGSQSGLGTGIAAAFTTPGFIASTTGAVLAAFAAIPKFADGGIVSGPTLGLMGEYAGAANNPEVIAPLNKLKDLIEPVSSDSGAVHLTGDFRINGSDLVLSLDRAMSRKKRLF